LQVIANSGEEVWTTLRSVMPTDDFKNLDLSTWNGIFVHLCWFALAD